jgi:hypothetical protein
LLRDERAHYHPSGWTIEEDPMGRDKGEGEGKKRSKKGLFAMLLAGIGAIVMIAKRKKHAEEPGWEEAKPVDTA